MGLGHSIVKKAVMYSTYSQNILELHQDDVLGIQSLYSISEFSRQNPVTTTSPRTTLQTTHQKIETSTHYESPSTSSHQPIPMKPNKCEITFDAISFIRHEIFIFKGRYMWRIPDRHSVSDKPIEIGKIWTGLPETFTKIDAFYKNKQQKQFWMFIENEIYVYGQLGNRVELFYTWNLTKLQLPTYIQKNYAIFSYGIDKQTFILASKNYSR